MEPDMRASSISEPQSDIALAMVVASPAQSDIAPAVVATSPVATSPIVTIAPPLPMIKIPSRVVQHAFSSGEITTMKPSPRKSSDVSENSAPGPPLTTLPSTSQQVVIYQPHLPLVQPHATPHLPRSTPFLLPSSGGGASSNFNPYFIPATPAIHSPNQTISQPTAASGTDDHLKYPRSGHNLHQSGPSVPRPSSHSSPNPSGVPPDPNTLGNSDVAGVVKLMALGFRELHQVVHNFQANTEDGIRDNNRQIEALHKEIRTSLDANISTSPAPAPPNSRRRAQQVAKQKITDIYWQARKDCFHGKSFFL